MPHALPLCLTIAAALLFPAWPAGAAGEEIRKPLTADEIVARYVAARGGYEKLKAIRTVVYRGTYHEPGSDPHPGAAMALMRPYYKIVGDPDSLSNDFREGYDGSAWEFYGDPGIVLRTVGAAAAVRGDDLVVALPTLTPR